MGKYLDILKSAGLYDKNDIDDKSRIANWEASTPRNQRDTFGRLNRFGRTYTALEARCPAHVDVARWQQCIEDGRSFLAKWGSQAEALGWTSADLFGLHTPPEKPRPSYRRLSRYDATGLGWLLDGREVVALTEASALIENPATGTTTLFRKNNRPALGPLGDSLDDFVSTERAARPSTACNEASTTNGK